MAIHGGFSGFGTDNDSSININFVGFSDNNFNNAELKQVVDAGDFKPVSSGYNYFQWQWRKTHTLLEVYRWMTQVNLSSLV